MTPIETLIAGLFDYAGLYPPATLDLRSAANNYLDYTRSKHSSALGRFIISFDHIDELRSIAGSSLCGFKLSLIVKEDTDWDSFAKQIEGGLPVESVEIKCSASSAIEHAARKIPGSLTTYFEVPLVADIEP
ncbi:MAG: hypothetical protein WBQ95_08995, partial [Terracidiphilus sp.]